MASADEVLSWTPRRSSGSSESYRGVVYPTTPGLVSTPRSKGEVAELRDLLHLHNAAMMERLETLMSQQERLINITLGVASEPGSPNRETSLQTYVNLFDDADSRPASVPAMSHSPTETDQLGHNGDTSFKRNYDYQPQPKRSPSSAGAKVAMFREALMSNHSAMAEAFTSQRELCRALLSNRYFDFAMTCIIIFNACLIIVETDGNAKECEGGATCVAPWVDRANLILLIIYTIESVIVIDAYRYEVLRQRSRMFEMFIVGTGWLDVLISVVFTSNPLPSLGLLKLIRLLRLLRGVRLLNFFPELYFIMVGFASAMRTMLWCCMMLAIILVFAAIISVELINPVNHKIDHAGNQLCTEAFESVWNATLLLFQTITAGDAWGTCTIPIVKKHPPTFIFFSFALVGIQVGFLNLIMSVILDRITEARAMDTSAKLQEKEKAREDSRNKWFELFERLDTDGSGALSLEELVEGFDNLPEFHEDLRLLGIERCDIAHLLNLMDEDNNERVDVHELVSMLEMITHFDLQMHQVTMGMQMRCMHQRLDKRLKKIDRELRSLAQRLPGKSTHSVPRPRTSTALSHFTVFETKGA